MGQVDKVAIAGSLAIVGGISLVGALPYIVKRRVDWRSVILFGLPGMAGTYGGAYLAQSGLTLSWVNKLGSEDSGAPPADSPGTSSRVVRTSFASIPGLSL